MNTTEYRAFINAEIDKAEAENGGPLPVVMWYHDKMLSEHVPTLVRVCEDQYTPDLESGLAKWDSARGKIFIIGD